MQACGDVSAAIGNTPLIRLRKASEITGCTILGKAVTLLCDHGSRYQSKLFDRGFLASRELPLPPWAERSAREGPA